MKTGQSNNQQKIFSMLGGKAVAHHPLLNQVFGLQSGLLLSQLLFWQGKGKKGDWVYKSGNDIQSEIGLTRSQLETAIKHLVSRKVVEVRVKGIPATRHFKIDMQFLISYINSLQESGKLGRPKLATLYAQKQRAITESTQENTSDNNTREEKINLEGKQKYEALKGNTFGGSHRATNGFERLFS